MNIYDEARNALNAINEAQDLEDLLECIRCFADVVDELDEDDAEAMKDQDRGEYKIFGGEAPKSTIGVWSWDADSLLVGTCYADMKIVPRAGE